MHYLLLGAAAYPPIFLPLIFDTTHPSTPFVALVIPLVASPTVAVAARLAAVVVALGERGGDRFSHTPTFNFCACVWARLSFLSSRRRRAMALDLHITA